MKDFLKKLLNKDQSKRLGSSIEDVEEIKKHGWFENAEWDKIIK